MKGIILFPDGYTQPNDVTAPNNINNTGNSWPTYSTSDFGKMANNGAVFLPAAGHRIKDSNNVCIKMDYYNGTCYYWTSTSNSTTTANNVVIGNYSSNPISSNNRSYGQSVRLVRE